MTSAFKDPYCIIAKDETDMWLELGIDQPGYAVIVFSSFSYQDETQFLMIPYSVDRLNFRRLKTNNQKDESYKKTFMNEFWGVSIDNMLYAEEAPKNPDNLGVMVFDPFLKKKKKDKGEFLYLFKDKNDAVTSQSYAMNMNATNVFFQGTDSALNYGASGFTHALISSHHYLSDTVNRFNVNRKLMDGVLHSESIEQLCESYDDLMVEVMSTGKVSNHEIEALKNIRQHFSNENQGANLVIF